MRVFHFINEKYGLDDLRRRRLKIALISDLNDPFELLSIELSHWQLRRDLQAAKQELSSRAGLLCFSKKWSNPVQWSHYADRHRGLCLGFDIPDEHLLPISYTGERLAKEAEKLLIIGSIDESTTRKLLSTKYAHWRYEQEMRLFVRLEDRHPENGFYFADFSDQLRLVQVIVGAQSTLSRRDLDEALGQLRKETTVFKARLAFKSFRVVRNKNESVWL